MNMLISRNPATGEPIKEIASFEIFNLPQIFERARTAQHFWSTNPVKRRARFLKLLRETILNHTDELCDLINQENGKTKAESLTTEILPIIHMLTHFSFRGPQVLKKNKLSLMLPHRISYLDPAPLGVVAIISPWNFPFMIPVCDIALALLAGNSVIFKPSELCSAIGQKIQDLFEEAGLPPYTLQTLFGDGALGEEVIKNKPDKVFFTGGVATGKRIMSTASSSLTPVSLELGGKNSIIILPDADLDFATSAALWGGFANTGQVCAANSRIFVQENQISLFIEKLKEKMALLRPPTLSGTNSEQGWLTSNKQKILYQELLDDARNRGLTILGGEFSENRRSLQPTIIHGPEIERSRFYTEEAFGPIVGVISYKTPLEAVEKTNQSFYGLTASIITRNFSLGESLAQKIQAGTIMINEVVYTAGLPEVPWGGIKQSGFGRVRSDVGLLEFTYLKHIHLPRSRLFLFKSFWWFPYTELQFQLFKSVLSLFRNHWTDRFRGFAHFMLCLVNYFKEERRL